MAKSNLASMSVEDLIKLREDVSAVLMRRAEDLKRQLARLDAESMHARDVRATVRKVAPQFRSRTDPSQQWTGRGATPRWMREEMKGTSLKKDDFRIRP